MRISIFTFWIFMISGKTVTSNSAVPQYRLTKFKKMSTFKDQLPTSEILWTHLNISITRCGGECLEDLQCQSFFHRQGSPEKICAGFKFRLAYDTISLNVENIQGMQHFHMVTGCEIDGYILDRSIGICFKIFTQTESKYDAASICELDGGNLITLDSQEKNNYIVTSILNENGGGAFWIGLSDSISEGTWIWRNGANALNTFWGFANGQPNNYDGDFTDHRRWNADCAAVTGGSSWLDDNCDKQRDFICEIEIK